MDISSGRWRFAALALLIALQFGCATRSSSPVVAPPDISGDPIWAELGGSARTLLLGSGINTSFGYNALFEESQRLTQEGLAAFAAGPVEATQRPQTDIAETPAFRSGETRELALWYGSVFATDLPADQTTPSHDIARLVEQNEQTTFTVSAQCDVCLDTTIHVGEITYRRDQAISERLRLPLTFAPTGGAWAIGRVSLRFDVDGVAYDERTLPVLVAPETAPAEWFGSPLGLEALRQLVLQAPDLFGAPALENPQLNEADAAAQSSLLGGSQAPQAAPAGGAAGPSEGAAPALPIVSEAAPPSVTINLSNVQDGSYRVEFRMSSAALTCPNIRELNLISAAGGSVAYETGATQLSLERSVERVYSPLHQMMVRESERLDGFTTDAAIRGRLTSELETVGGRNLYGEIFVGDAEKVANAITLCGAEALAATGNPWTIKIRANVLLPWHLFHPRRNSIGETPHELFWGLNFVISTDYLSRPVAQSRTRGLAPLSGAALPANSPSRLLMVPFAPWLARTRTEAELTRVGRNTLGPPPDCPGGASTCEAVRTWTERLRADRDVARAALQVEAQLRRLFGEAPTFEYSRPAEVTERLTASQTLAQASVLAFYSHHEVEREIVRYGGQQYWLPSVSGKRLRLGTRSFGAGPEPVELTVSAIANAFWDECPARGPCYQTRPLVLLMGCGTAALSVAERDEALASLFLGHGASGVLGTSADITPAAVERFMRLLLRDMTQGQTVGRAVLNARRSMWRARTPEGVEGGYLEALLFEYSGDANTTFARDQMIR